MRPPDFITFTGAGDDTSIAGMLALSECYPVEWGILLSRSRQGEDPRYPGDPSRFLGCRLRFAAHLCGAYSREIMAGELARLPYLLRSLSRVQVNHASPHWGYLGDFQRSIARPVIAQTRGTSFPTFHGVEWLFDASGGRGIGPGAWPAHPGHLVGYAGGIGPENVRDALATIGATGPYWIDMESGVRTDDRFDLEKCRRVCEAVYGAPPRATPPVKGRE